MTLDAAGEKRYQATVTQQATASLPNQLPPTQLPLPGDPSTLYLVDLSGYVFRAYHALPPLSNRQGEPTHALHGVMAMLTKLLQSQRPAMLALVADSKGPSFRQEIYAGYKANRPPPPPDLSQQMTRLIELVTALGIPLYAQAGMEADDLIATLVRQARRCDLRVVIVSADKDLLQLVESQVCMFDSMRQRVFGIAETVEKMGVLPTQVGDLLALTGDSSDNVPGVPSVGPKTAAELLGAWGDLNGVYAHLDEIRRPALRQKLSDHRDAVQLSRQLVALRDDVVLDFDPEKLRYRGGDVEKARPLMVELELHRLLAQLESSSVATATVPAAPAPAAVAVAYRRLGDALTVDALAVAAAVAAIRQAARVAIAIVVEAEGGVAAAPLGLALAWDAAAVAFLPWTALAQPEALPLRSLLADPAIAKLSADAKTDWLRLQTVGVALAGVRFDVSLASYLLQSGRDAHDLGAVLRRELHEELPSVEGSEVEPQRRDGASAASGAASAVWRLSERLRSQLVASGLDKLLDDVELPLAVVLGDMQRVGVRVDAECLRALSVTVQEKMQQLERQCQQLAGGEFNVASPRQLEAILFDKLSLPVIKKTKTARSTDHEVLEELAALHELPAAILEHRSLAKLKGTYLDALPPQIDAQSGRLHTQFHQTVAATGRLSSSDPNVQNIPIRTELGRAIRAAFVPEPGWSMLSADYSQIELRVLAHLSGDEQLIEAFSANEDVHLRTASALFGVPRDQVTRDMRGRAKTVNFAVLYGQTQFALAKSLRIDRAEAKRYIDAFFERYAGVKRYMDGVLGSARQSGEVRTLLGRRRIIADLHSKNANLRAAAERIACNTPVQGSAADIIKLAMVAIHREMTKSQLRARMVLTVHDELVFEAPEDEQERLSELVLRHMQQAHPLLVPLVVEHGWGRSWGEAH